MDSINRNPPTLAVGRFNSHDVNLFIEGRIKGGLCFDVGANVGSKSEVYLNMGARVVCVEPDPACVKVIRGRFGDKVTVVECALGEEIGTGMLMLSTAPTLNTLSREFIEVAGKVRFSRYSWSGQIQVPISTIEQLVGDYGIPQYCKIDVEGYEEEVLKGMKRPLPFLSFEFTPELKKNADACMAVLSERGTYVYNFSRGESQKFVFSEWKMWGEMSKYLEAESQFGDVFAVLRE